MSNYEVRFEIRYIHFNGEYHADIFEGDEKVNYIASDDIALLMRNVSEMVINHFKLRVTNERR